MLHAADGLGERRMIVAGKVEEAEQIVIPDVEEEVAGAGVVAVLDQFHQRETEEFLVEADGLLGVLADQGEGMDAPEHLHPPAFWLWHPCLLAPAARAAGTPGRACPRSS